MPKLIRTFLVAGAVVVVLFLLLELFARVVMPVDPYGEGRVNFRNQSEHFEDVSSISMTGQGLMPSNWRESDASQRVLCVGGANTLVPLQGMRQVWWGQLEEKLDGVDVTAVALPNRPLVDVARWVEDFEDLGEFDEMVVLLGVQDFRILNADSDLSVDAQGDALFAKKPASKAFILRNFALARMLNNARGSQQATLDRVYGELSEPNAVVDLVEQQQEMLWDMRIRREVPYPPLEDYDGEPQALVDDVVAQMKTALDRMVARCDEAGVQLVVVYEPVLEDGSVSPSEIQKMTDYTLYEDSPFAVSPQWYSFAYARADEAFDQWAQDVDGVRYVSMRTAIPADLEHHFTEIYLTDKGARALAQQLVDVVQGELE